MILILAVIALGVLFLGLYVRERLICRWQRDTGIRFASAPQVERIGPSHPLFFWGFILSFVGLTGLIIFAHPLMAVFK